MQDKIIFKLETDVSGGGNSGNSAGNSMGNDLAKSISNLGESVKKLSSDFSTFKDKLSQIKAGEPSYIQQTSRVRAEGYKARAEALNNPEQQVIAKNRAEANLLRNQTEKQRQELKSNLLNRADEYKAAGDTRFAKKIEGDVSASLSNGINKGVNNSKLAQVMTAIGGAAVFVNGVSKLIGAETSSGLSMMQNPYTSGYNYGGQVAGVMQAQAQRENAYVGMGTAVAGGLASLIPGIGPLLGAGIMGAGQLYGAYNSSQSTLQSTAATSLVNNTMNAQALSATNQAASGIYNQGSKGRRITDVEQPLIMAMSKAAGVYNRNFKEIDKLTDYVRAGNMSIQQGAGLAGAVSFMTKGMSAKDSSSFIDNMKQSFSAYGVMDPASAAATAMLFKQAGMSAGEATELAARSSGMNPGAQGALSGYFGDTLSGRGIKNLISQQVFGVNLEDVVTGRGDKNAARYRNSSMNFIKSGNLNDLDPLAMGFEQLYNLTNYQTAGKQRDSRNITSTPEQQLFSDMTNSSIAKNADGMSLDKAIGILNGEVDHAAKTFTALNDAVQSVNSSFNGLSDTLSKVLLGQTGKMVMGSSTAGAKKSGNTGVRYNPISESQQKLKSEAESWIKNWKNH